MRRSSSPLERRLAKSPGKCPALAASMLSSSIASTNSQSRRLSRHVRGHTVPSIMPFHCERRASVRSLSLRKYRARCQRRAAMKAMRWKIPNNDSRIAFKISRAVANSWPGLKAKSIAHPVAVLGLASRASLRCDVSGNVLIAAEGIFEAAAKCARRKVSDLIDGGKIFCAAGEHDIPGEPGNDRESQP